MKVTITHPEMCPHYSPGYCHKEGLCGHPGALATLFCDTHLSAIAKDGFPLNCPLRMEQD